MIALLLYGYSPYVEMWFYDYLQIGISDPVIFVQTQFEDLTKGDGNEKTLSFNHLFCGLSYSQITYCVSRETTPDFSRPPWHWALTNEPPKAVLAWFAGTFLNIYYMSKSSGRGGAVFTYDQIPPNDHIGIGYGCADGVETHYIAFIGDLKSVH